MINQISYYLKYVIQQFSQLSITKLIYTPK